LQGEEQTKLLRIQGEHIARQGEHIDRIIRLLEKDGEYIRSLARIAEMHDRRISGLESGQSL